MTLSNRQADALSEIINMGVGRAAGILNQILKTLIQLQVPRVHLSTVDEFQAETDLFAPETLSAVQMDFQGPFSGNAVLLFPEESGTNLVKLVTGGQSGGDDLDSLRSGALAEVGNIVLNGVMGVMANFLNRRLNYAVPRYCEIPKGGLSRELQLESSSMIIVGEACFSADDHLIAGKIVLLFGVESFSVLIDSIEAVPQQSPRV